MGCETIQDATTTTVIGPSGGAVLQAVDIDMETMTDAFMTAVALAVFGATIAGIDVAMNIQAVAVERAAGRPMMSRSPAPWGLTSPWSRARTPI